jgi:CreA protein
MRSTIIVAALLAIATIHLSGTARAADGDSARIGAVDTTFRLMGRNDRVVIDRYDDPKVEGVSCYVSRAETGGVKGTLGLATDPNRFSIACRATGAVQVRGNIPDNEVVFGEKASPFFKEIRVSRLFDRQKQVLLYLVWSTISLGVDGSAYNSVTAVPLNH